MRCVCTRATTSLRIHGSCVPQLELNLGSGALKLLGSMFASWEGGLEWLLVALRLSVSEREAEGRLAA